MKQRTRFSILVAVLVGAVAGGSPFASAEEGMDRWNRRPGDAVICDWLMDGMPAHAFAAAVRVLSPDARIIALSALAAGAVGRQAGAGTLDVILEKPVVARDLARALSAH